MKKDFTLIAFGHKARQGKDITATFINKCLYSNSKIFHWADHLYNEMRNAERKFPLIVLSQEKKFFSMFHRLDALGHAMYKIYPVSEFTELLNIMNERNITEYWGMDEKDAPMLQQWGTNYRRAKIDFNYWVNLTMKDVYSYVYSAEEENPLVLIPDTRYNNELEVVRAIGGIYVNVVRTENGKQYIDPSRDPNHQSEVELNNARADFTIYAQSGDIAAIEDQARKLYQLYVFANKEDSIEEYGDEPIEDGVGY